MIKSLCGVARELNVLSMTIEYDIVSKPWNKLIILTDLQSNLSLSIAEPFAFEV